VKKTTAAKTTRAIKKPSSTKRGGRRKVGSAAPVVPSKTRSAAGARPMPAQRAGKQGAQKSTRTLSTPAGASQKANEVGRAVGSILGKAIGNIERVVTRLTKPAQRATKK